MGDVACYTFVVVVPFEADEPFSEVLYSIVKLAAECQEEFGSVHNNTPTGFTYYIKTEEVAEILKRIHGNLLNHLDSISLTESTTKNEKRRVLMCWLEMRLLNNCFLVFSDGRMFGIWTRDSRTVFNGSPSQYLLKLI